MRYALVQNNVVVNIIEADAAFAASIAHEWQHVAHADGAGIGWGWDGSAFVAPAPTAPTVPPKVTRRQARQALLLAGLLDDVQPAINAIADPMQRGLAQIEWDDAQEFERHRPLLMHMATALGLDDEALDNLFIQAASL